MEKISETMLNEHKRLHEILEKLENDSKYGSDGWKELFNEFKWNLEKHFFVEEKAIFELCNSSCGDKIPEIFDLMKEHGDILFLINEIDEEMDENIGERLADIKKMLVKHSEFEDDDFYPLLDNKLSEERKKEILSRVKDIVH